MENLSLDVFELLIHLLDGHDVLRLLYTGNCVIRRKIVDCGPKMTFEMNAYEKYPSWVYNLTKLHTLSVNMKETDIYYPLKGCMESLLPKQPLKDVKKFQLQVLTTIPISSYHLTRSFPSLEDLDIHTFGMPISIQGGTGQWPSTLTSLSLVLKSDSANMHSWFQDELFDALPVHLETLKLEGMLVKLRKEGEELKCPIGLRCLSMVLYGSPMWSKLPLNLEYLDLTIASKSDAIEPFVSISTLPPCLKSVIIDSTKTTFTLDSDMNPNITLWDALLNIPSIENLKRYLPKSLKYARFLTLAFLIYRRDTENIFAKLTDPEFLEIFPNITKIDTTSSQSLLERLSPYQLNQLPNSLTELDLGSAPVRKSTEFRFLGSQLQDGLDPLHENRLNGNMVQVWKEFAGARLTVLSKLRLPIDWLGSPEALTYLPQSLTRFCITLSVDSEMDFGGAQHSTLLDSRWGSFLPSSIIELEITSDMVCSAWRYWLLHVSHLSSLESLYITDSTIDFPRYVPTLEEINPYQEHEYLSQLPRSLRRLWIPVSKIAFEEILDYLHHLPPQLVFLNINCPFGTMGLVEHFSKLPGSLTSFHAPSCNFPESVFSTIPGHIPSLVIGCGGDRILWNEEMRAYKSKARWNQPGFVF